ncbi:AAA family ATPase [Aestuariibaculum marinum]|uniref:Recombinase RecF n=1 Tax=Aestuariibaculum marinum TaxID=2683592 RepID=A0A8J6U6B9_9FLAO|nr:AAA family ATPase [Aestuariibaculum marinum]MBD0822611.1 recombinase RecF [Aestuariibaculum marinum]
MKTIKIITLKLTNFKGIRSLFLNNIHNETFVYGDNGVGKTTIFDAFTWLLFGKDSTDRQSFEIKTLDENNNIIPKIDHEVEAEILVDGKPVLLRRILREKWVKPKGALEAQFSGNETSYEWNGVPMNAGDYAAKISQIVDEKVFKMITNPASFNALKWQDQRSVLIDMAGNITDQDVIKGNPDFEYLFTKLVGKDLEEYKKQVKASILKSKKELQTIPTRIDEVRRSMPEALNFEALRTELSQKTKAIEEVNDQISDNLKANEAEFQKKRGFQTEIHAIETAIGNKRHEIQQLANMKFNELNNKPREIQREIANLDGTIKYSESNIESKKARIKSHKYNLEQTEKKMAALRSDWEKENATEFKMDEDACACPTCKRAFDAANIEEKRADLEQYFHTNKKANLKRITEQGQNLKSEKLTTEKLIESEAESIIALEAEVKALWEKRADFTAELKAFSNTKTQNEIYTELLQEHEAFFSAENAKIKELKAKLDVNSGFDNSALKAKLSQLNQEADGIKSQLQLENQIKTANTRITELSQEEGTLAQSIADLEKDQYIIDAFEKEKCTRIEDSVNSRFSLVNFKLFETQINGGEVPTCKALINGVPFSDANTASKINAGLDIINTLCFHYQANAPIFIDNRESVVQLIPSQSQIINLIVSEEDKKLRVSERPMSYSEYAFNQNLATA